MWQENLIKNGAYILGIVKLCAKLSPRMLPNTYSPVANIAKTARRIKMEFYFP